MLRGALSTSSTIRRYYVRGYRPLSVGTDYDTRVIDYGAPVSLSLYFSYIERETLVCSRHTFLPVTITVPNVIGINLDIVIGTSWYIAIILDRKIGSGYVAVTQADVKVGE
jgi:hypothetical protein